MQQSYSFVSGPEDYKNLSLEDGRSNLLAQLDHQNKYLARKGYNYPHQKDMPFINNYMMETLSQAGITDLRQLGMKEVEGEPVEQRIFKEGNKYYKYVQTGMAQTKVTIDPKDLIDIKETEGASLGYGAKEKIITAKVKPPIQRILINKDTGEQVVQGKYGGVLGYGNAQDTSDGLLRWGNTTQTEGMTDFMIQFDKDGQALIVPKYSDTATDLTGLTMVATVALASMGVPAQLGSLSGVTGSYGAVAGKAFGNALINSSFTALQGGDFASSFGKNMITSMAVPAISKGLDTAMGNTIFANMPTDSLFREVAGGAINRSITEGLVAAVSGRDVGEAMKNGALRGAFKAGGTKLMTSIFDESDLKFITDNSNLEYKDVIGLGTMGIRTGVMNLVQGRDFTENIGSTLMAYGASTVVGNSIENRLGEKLQNNPGTYQFLKNSSEVLTRAYVKAAAQGKQLSPEQIQQIFINQALKKTKRKVKKTILAPTGLGKETRKSFSKEGDLKLRSQEDFYANIRGD